MTRVAFGVAPSSFAANMALKQNAIDHAEEYPLAAAAVHGSFYVDDGLVGADTSEEARKLQKQLQELFARGGFLLRKWKASDPAVLEHLSPTLLDPQPSHEDPGSGVESCPGQLLSDSGGNSSIGDDHETCAGVRRGQNVQCTWLVRSFNREDQDPAAAPMGSWHWMG